MRGGHLYVGQNDHRARHHGIAAVRHPNVGEMVHYFTGDTDSAAAPFHPAVITRVLDDQRVNSRVFFDMSNTVPVHDQRTC